MSILVQMLVDALLMAWRYIASKNSSKSDTTMTPVTCPRKRIGCLLGPVTCVKH